MLRIKKLKKKFNGVSAIDSFSCRIMPKEIVALIGPNGAGKTTLFNCINGFIKQESGTIHFDNMDLSRKKTYQISKLGISRTFQILRLIKQISVIDNLLLSFPERSFTRLKNIFFKSKQIKKIEENYGKSAYELLEYAGLYEYSNELAGNLSYGQQKLLNILCCIASDANLLLLDEPIAGLNPEIITKILSILENQRKNGKSILLIEHNMEAIDQICDRVIFMDEGRLISEGTPEAIRNDPKVIDAYLN